MHRFDLVESNGIHQISTDGRDLPWVCADDKFTAGWKKNKTTSVFIGHLTSGPPPGRAEKISNTRGVLCHSKTNN